jgi:hypothetical protein
MGQYKVQIWPQAMLTRVSGGIHQHAMGHKIHESTGRARLLAGMP